MDTYRCEFVMRTDGTLSVQNMATGQETVIKPGERFCLHLPLDVVSELFAEYPSSTAAVATNK